MISDETTTIDEMKNRIKEFIDERDWRKYHKPKDIAVSISIEASELMEIFQWLSDEEVDELTNSPSSRKSIRFELADIMSYVLILSIALNIDLSRAVFEKISRNEMKYPVDRVRGKHGKPLDKR